MIQMMVEFGRKGHNKIMNNMKRIISLIITFTCFLVLNANILDSLHIIKGYYITRYLKKEILSFYEGKIAQIDNMSFSIPIDFEHKSFFIPLSIDGVKIKNDSNLLKEYSMNKDTIFYLPLNKRVEKYIEYLFNKEISLSKSISILSEVKKSFPYYVIDEDENYLYKCVYIEGESWSKRIENARENLFILDLDIDAINHNSLEIQLYFIVDIIYYTPFVNMAHLKEWYPYLK